MCRRVVSRTAIDGAPALKGRAWDTRAGYHAQLFGSRSQSLYFTIRSSSAAGRGRTHETPRKRENLTERGNGISGGGGGVRRSGACQILFCKNGGTGEECR